MRTFALSLFVYLGISFSSAAAAEPLAVRAMDAAAAQALDRGRAASAAFRGLLAGFDPAEVVVHVVSGDTIVFGSSGATRLAGRAGAWRYLRITLDPDLPLDERTAVLAHELQHAHEIIAGAAGTQRDMERLFERIGRKVVWATNTFETPEAIEAGTRVWRELRTRAARASGPGRAAVDR